MNKVHGQNLEEDVPEKLQDSPSVAMHKLKELRDFVLSYIRASEISEKVCEVLAVSEVQIGQQAVNNLKQKTITEYFTTTGSQYWNPHYLCCCLPIYKLYRLMNWSKGIHFWQCMAN
jgi:hypothetical protein